MRISVKVKPKSGKVFIEKTGHSDYLIAVKSAAVGGKANEDLIKTLAEYFDVPRYLISIASGHKSRKKIIDIEGINPG